MADIGADSSNTSNPESSNPTNNSQAQKRDKDDQVSSSVVIAPGRLFTTKSPVGPRGEGDSSDSSSSERSRSTPLLRPSAFNPSSSSDRTLGSPFSSRLFGKADEVSSSTCPDSSKKAFILRPSALDKHTASIASTSSTAASAAAEPPSTNAFRTSFRLEPAKMVNPFAKKVEDERGGGAASAADSSATDPTQTEQEPTDAAAAATDSIPTENDTGANSENTSEAQTKQAKTGGAFIFGENLASRVVSAPSPEKNGDVVASGVGAAAGDEREASKAEDSDVAEAALPPANDCTTPESTKESPTSSSSGGVVAAGGQTLEQSAAAEQAKHNKPSLQQVEVITGEEDESNVFHLNTKLFIFEKDTQSWLERGRGQLRLNDMSGDEEDPNAFQSRLVMRTSGNLRVVLNTKIWPDMTIERASPKSIRLTAFDADNNIKIFLIMTGNKDADQIFSAIDWRIQQLRVSSKSDLPPALHSGDLKRPRPASDVDDADSSSAACTPKKHRADGTDESTVDPETEVSSESFGSSTREFSSDA